MLRNDGAGACSSAPAPRELSPEEFVRLRGDPVVDLAGCRDLLEELAACGRAAPVPLFLASDVIRDLKVTYADQPVFPAGAQLKLTEALSVARHITARGFDVLYYGDSILLVWSSRDR